MVTDEQVTQFLAYVAVYDNRNVTEMEVIAWKNAFSVARLPLTAEAYECVSAYYGEAVDNADSYRRLTPSHVTSYCRRLRADRLEGFVYEPTAADEDPDTYLARYREQRAAVAAGQRPAAPSGTALTGSPPEELKGLLEGVGRTVEDSEAAAAKDALNAHRRTPAGSMSVECPSCGARIGKHCTLPSGRPRQQPHPKRTAAAAVAA